MKNFLAIRLSSLGDVALAVPVIKAVIAQNRDIHITLLTRKNFQALFKDIPSLSFAYPDLNGKHKGISGVYRLFKELKEGKNYDAVIDLHNVLRSQILSTFFKMKGVKVFRIDKGREQKRALTRPVNKILNPLTSTTERYAEVFRKAGLKVDLTILPKGNKTSSLSEIARQFLGEKNQPWIGVAPFAQHTEKMYPIEKMKLAISGISEQGIKIFLFGGGKEEKDIAEEIADDTKIVSLVGRFSLENELALMGEMDLMLTMDSANMHLANLGGTKVISVWGATHSYAGFAPFGQNNEEQMIQTSTEDLSCRPCSVFGNKPCFRKDLACLNSISPETIIKKIQDHLGA